MQSILELLEPYAELECAIQQLMAQLFSDACSMCTACCCRADVCEEATESAFLSQLLDRQEIAAENLDNRYGWLDLHGCALEYGRPPVCYTYFCNDLLNDLPDDEIRHVARTLGRLMNHVGESALGEWHLVDIMDASDLERIDPEGIAQRLEEARSAYQVIEEYIQTGRLTASGRGALDLISTHDP